MKRFFSNLILFAALSIAFSGLTACPSSSGGTSNQNISVEESNANSADKPEKTQSLAPPAALIQAEIKMIDGTAFKLPDKKGKVVLINLWATWCGPCRAEMPALIEMQEKFRDKNFEIIGLDVGDYDTKEPEPVEVIKPFAEKMKLNYQLGWADEDFFNQFNKVTQGGGVIPQSILLNREGNITGIFTGGSKKVINAMRETVEKVVNE